MGLQRRRRAVAPQQARPALRRRPARAGRALVGRATPAAAIRRRRRHGAAMQLSLQAVEQQVGAQAYLYPLDLALESGAVTVLLGATQAGKTSLMRVMAG